jgi:hypothetical protein
MIGGGLKSIVISFSKIKQFHANEDAFDVVIVYPMIDHI